ncbi:rapamycin-insensitive companion of mTOR isoform X2 [Schistocerca americana]|uniref:rapamycin-insensitive companion of mTOR isoform X2 n=1 Tax=Schistocerca americana TaxID=7009 RepID=UPI001F4FAF6D|nr:rapamycin-insensitive companion of mTOR isoform X2 [Schistocerca americana]
MAIASWMLRGRSSRAGRSIRSPQDSEDDVQIDFSRDASEICKEVLHNLCRKKGLTEGKIFSYISALVKLISKVNGPSELGYSVEQLQCCLRVPLIHEASRVRAAALQAVRYTVKEEKHVRSLYSLNYPYLIARCLDVNLRNDMERVQALRLVRRLLALAPGLFPPAIVRSLVSLANGAVEEKDQMLRACLATLAEICVLNSPLFIECGGVAAVSRNVLSCQMPRISETLSGVLLFLLNHPSTRRRASIFLSTLAAPYCDFHVDCSSRAANSAKEDRVSKFVSSRLALLSVLRSWPGVLHFCHPNNVSGFQAIVDILYLRQQEVRKAVLELLYDLIDLPHPEWTDEFSVALEAVDPARPQSGWKLSEGFVAAEGRAVLPHLSKVRPNLSEVHMALLMYIFVETGLLEAIVEVIVTSDLYISVRATMLLGVLLHKVHLLLPPECCDLTPALPNLLSHAANTADKVCQQRALAAVAALHRLHSLLSRRPAPASLFLDQLLQPGRKSHSRSLQTQYIGLKKLEDSNCRTFMRRLVNYFKPSSNRFSRVEVGNRRQTHIYTLAGCELIDCLLEAEEPEGGKLLPELLADIWQHIDGITSSKTAHDCLFSPQNMQNSLCQYYFLFIGRMCRTNRGQQTLEKAGILQQLLNLVGNTNHECYIKLVVSGLDYSLDGIPRTILRRVLTSTSESLRLYATQMMTVFLRAKVTDFHKWGVEMLVAQLQDTSRSVCLAAVSVLMEAAEEEVYLEALISHRPSLLHLGDRGLLLFIRFFSTPAGFSLFQDDNVVSNHLHHWFTSYNYRYVGVIEGELHDSLTLHKRGEDGRYVRRISNVKQRVADVYVPPHLYGQLAQHEAGFRMLLDGGHLSSYFQIVHVQNCSTEKEILELKAALWVCGHVATSVSGLSLLSEEGVVQAIVKIAETSDVYSIRGTAVYVLGLIATTFHGANELRKAGWLSVRHDRHERWPVIEEQIDIDLCSSSEADSVSTSSSAVDMDCQKNFFIDDDEISEDEAAVLSWNDSSGSSGPRTSKPTNIPQQKSQTLPHWRPPRHVRSMSECKQSSPVWDQADTSDRVQKLSPIPSSTSLNTLKSSNQQRRNSHISYRKHSTQGSVSSEGVASSPDATSSKLSHQDLQGYATLRSLNRYRLPFYPDSTTLAAEELLYFEEFKGNTSLLLALRMRSSSNQFSQQSLCEFEASMPPRLGGVPSSASLGSKGYFPNYFSIGRQTGPSRQHDETRQCYMGISLPQQLSVLFPTEECHSQQHSVATMRHRCSVSFSEMDEVAETDEPVGADSLLESSSSSSETEDLDGGLKEMQKPVSKPYHHLSAACLACCRTRSRKVSSSSYRHRTDTESSCGGADSPVILNRKGRTCNAAMLVANSGGSVDSNTYLEIPPTQQEEDEDIVLSKSFVRKQILKNIERMSNPVWTKISKQSLLQLKQKYPASFQDVCLYSEVSYKLAHSTYRLMARRFIQELFLDLTFDVLYEEPVAILSSPALSVHSRDDPSLSLLANKDAKDTEDIMSSASTPTVYVSDVSNITDKSNFPFPVGYRNENHPTGDTSQKLCVDSVSLCAAGDEPNVYLDSCSGTTALVNVSQQSECVKQLTSDVLSGVKFPTTQYSVNNRLGLESQAQIQQYSGPLHQDNGDIPMIDEAINFTCIASTEISRTEGGCEHPDLYKARSSLSNRRGITLPKVGIIGSGVHLQKSAIEVDELLGTGNASLRINGEDCALGSSRLSNVIKSENCNAPSSDKTLLTKLGAKVIKEKENSRNGNSPEKLYDVNQTTNETANLSSSSCDHLDSTTNQSPSEAVILDREAGQSSNKSPTPTSSSFLPLTGINNDVNEDKPTVVIRQRKIATVLAPNISLTNFNSSIFSSADKHEDSNVPNDIRSKTSAVTEVLSNNTK